MTWVRTRPRNPFRRRGGRRRGDAGYNMVVLMVLVTVLHVLVAAVLPAWSGAIQREKEEELIFRGLQYAEAIRVFQARQNRPPVRLEELVEVEPRSIRRLWEDPMTGEARWGLIFAGAGVPIPGQGEGQNGDAEGAGGGENGGFDAAQPPPITSGEDQVTQGPISGVYSLARGESMIEFQGKQAYSEWHFTVDLLQRGPEVAAGTGNVRLGPGTPLGVGSGSKPLPDLSSRWIGRPWPEALEQSLQQGGVPGEAGARPAGGNAAGGGDDR